MLGYSADAYSGADERESTKRLWLRTSIENVHPLCHTTCHANALNSVNHYAEFRTVPNLAEEILLNLLSLP